MSRDEYHQLREELKKSRKAVSLVIGEKAKTQEQEKAFTDMLTPLQQQRQKFLARKKSSTTARQQETLARLAKFKATLSAAHEEKKQPSDHDEGDAKPQSETKAAYHGQVLSEGSDDEEDPVGKDKSWMTAKLKFKKHIDVRSKQHRFVVDSDLMVAIYLMVLGPIPRGV